MQHDQSTMYLLRHGATASNEAGVLQGRGVDHCLCEVGRTQILAASGEMSTRRIAAIYCSPLRRAVESAEIVAGQFDLTVEIAPQLMEVDVGRWEGQSWSEIAEKDASAYVDFMESEGRCGYPEGESYAQVAERVAPAFAALLRRHAGKQFCVVAHSVVNRVYLASTLGMPPDHARRLQQANGCINVVRRRGDKTSVVTINAAMHVS